MIGDYWYLGPLVALLLANCLAAALALWVRARRSDRAPDAAAASGGGERVACRECGAENDPVYRFCRQCVSELPGPSPYTPGRGRSRPVAPR